MAKHSEQHEQHTRGIADVMGFQILLLYGRTHSSHTHMVTTRSYTKHTRSPSRCRTAGQFQNQWYIYLLKKLLSSSTHHLPSPVLNHPPAVVRMEEATKGSMPEIAPHSQGLPSLTGEVLTSLCGLLCNSHAMAGPGRRDEGMRGSCIVCSVWNAIYVLHAAGRLASIMLP